MKKFFATLLALCLIMSLGVSAFAIDGGATPPTPIDSVTITKNFNLANEGTVSPAASFTVEQVENGSSVLTGDAQTAPALTITAASFDEGAAKIADAADAVTGTITITLPTYDHVGEYQYQIKERATTLGGVAIDEDTYYLVVDVVNIINTADDGTVTNEVKPVSAKIHQAKEDGTKSDTKITSITNTYSAGTLNITNTVTGNMGDKDRYFEYTLTLTGEAGKTYTAPISVSGGSEANNPTAVTMTPANGQATGTISFKLKDAETLSVANIPYGVSYSVTQTAVDGYTTTPDTLKYEGTIEAAAAQADFENNKEAQVDTGINTDSMPYVITLGLVLVLGVSFLVKRKVSRNH